MQGAERKPLSAAVDCDLLSKSQELTSFVENILQEIKSPAPIKDQMTVDDRSFSVTIKWHEYRFNHSFLIHGFLSVNQYGF